MRLGGQWPGHPGKTLRERRGIATPYEQTYTHASAEQRERAEQDQAQARRAICGSARDKDDALLLLDACGLLAVTS